MDNQSEEVVKSMDTSIRLFGRKKIYTSVDYIDQGNVKEELNKALIQHFQNIVEEDYLHNYRRGVQPILNRTKEIRPEICNKVVVNNADMVVKFKNGYFLTKPATYVSRVEEESVNKMVRELNEYLYASGKHHVDNEVVNDFHTMGLGVAFLEPNKSNRKPVKVYNLSPQSAFCVYSLRPGNEPVFGVHMVTTETGVLFDVFTNDSVYHLSGGNEQKKMGEKEIFEKVTIANHLDSVNVNQVGLIPIIEFSCNKDRLSAFETAIPLMDAINNMESNRADGVEQTIQQLCVAYNCQFEEGTTANSIRQAGMIVLKSTSDNKADFKILESSLSQSDTQTTLDDLYEQMLEKCGVPSSVRDGGSTSDNVGAVYLRSGWASADTDARNTEDFFRESNSRFTEVFLRILKMKMILTELEPEDIDICLVRNQMDNLLVKTQACLNMKQLGFSPELALERSGLSNDPVNDVAMSGKYMEDAWNQQEPQQNVQNTNTQLE